MKKAMKIVIAIVVILILTFSSVFLKIIPCKSWVAGTLGIISTFPKNTFCNLSPSSISYGPYNVYYYLTTNLTYAFLITLIIFSVIVIVLELIINKLKSTNKK